MSGIRTWVSAHQTVTVVSALLLGAGCAGTVGAIVAGGLRADLASETHARDRAEKDLDDLRTNIDEAHDTVSSLEQTNGRLTGLVFDLEKRQKALRREIGRLKASAAELGGQPFATVRQVLCDPGGCENPAYSPNPAYATYCDPGATFAYEGQCSYGD